jgi:hypothetical protein
MRINLAVVGRALAAVALSAAFAGAQNTQHFETHEDGEPEEEDAAKAEPAPAPAPARAAPRVFQAHPGTHAESNAATPSSDAGSTISGGGQSVGGLGMGTAKQDKPLGAALAPAAGGGAAAGGGPVAGGGGCGPAPAWKSAYGTWHGDLRLKNAGGWAKNFNCLQETWGPQYAFSYLMVIFGGRDDASSADSYGLIASREWRSQGIDQGEMNRIINTFESGAGGNYSPGATVGYAGASCFLGQFSMYDEKRPGGGQTVITLPYCVEGLDDINAPWLFPPLRGAGNSPFTKAFASGAADLVKSYNRCYGAKYGNF